MAGWYLCPLLLTLIGIHSLTHAFHINPLGRGRVQAPGLHKAHRLSPWGRSVSLYSTVAEPVVEEEVTERVIRISDAAMAHLMELKAKENADRLYLRMGVRSGGCSGLSYVMDLVKAKDITEEDHIEEYPNQGVTCVVDPKSMLYLFGLVLDYKDALIGGGFQFFNPSAESTCGCGKSFGV